MIKKMTLLEQAKDFHLPRGRKNTEVTDEDIELVIAWFNGDVQLNQLQKVKKLSSASGAYTFIAITAREIYRKSK